MDGRQALVDSEEASTRAMQSLGDTARSCRHAADTMTKVGFASLRGIIDVYRDTAEMCDAKEQEIFSRLRNWRADR